jgi:hypothetical protein
VPRIRSFTPFLRLPQELQDLVWTLYWLKAKTLRAFNNQYVRKYPIESLGIPFTKRALELLPDIYISEFARYFRDLRELVVLVGHRLAQCKVVPVSMAEDTIALQSNGLPEFVEVLKRYLDRASQAHKIFQTRQ